MKFSILLCTRNSQRLIEEVLYSLINQDDKNAILEIIIVDYKSTDSTLPIARKIIAESNIILVEINCEISGKSPALVLGLDAARGNYIVIVDDDNVLYPDYIREAKKILLNNKIGCVGAQGVIDDKLLLPDWFLKYKSIYAIGLPMQGKNIDWVWGAASIISKTAWSKLRSEEFRFILNPERQTSSTPISIGGEDVELSLAIKLIGYEVVISNKLKFIHSFEQSRLTENYLIRTSYGVSRAVAAHEIYRTIIYQSTLSFARIRWYLRVFRKMAGCCKNILKSLANDDSLNRKIFQSTLLGIGVGLIYFGPQYAYIYSYLLKVHEKNKSY